MNHSQVQVGDISLHVVEAGEGEPIVSLHGFPEFWYSWRHQIEALSVAGFRAIAPDLRSYGQSDRPRDVANYATEHLVGDIIGLIEHVGSPVYLVGHEWGGVIAWRLAMLRPDLLRKLAILNAPHPARFRRELATNPLQWLRSAYVLFFQLPWLPEQLINSGNFRNS